VRVDGKRVDTELLIGADGVNGASARSLGLAGNKVYAVALEGKLPYEHSQPERWQGTLALELGTILGGYGWIFPKGDHVNVGIGGWQSEGPRLRQQFKAFCGRYGIDSTKVDGLRGYRLVARRPGSALASGCALLVGDAAGLIDPLLGDGLSESFLSARLAAATALDFLAGRIPTLEPYTHAVLTELGPAVGFSWNAKLALDRLPRIVMAGVLSPPGWGVIENMICGEIPQPLLKTRLQGAAVHGLQALAWLAGRPGEAYQIEARTHRIRSNPLPISRDVTRHVSR
jgi:flavin-dependent dehydrogenase